MLSETVRASVEFPSDDESTGIVRFEWHTVPVSDHYTRSAIDTLLSYLTDTSVAELKRAFVEADPPLAGSVYPSSQESNPTTSGFTFDSVPKDKLALIEPKLVEVLTAFCGASEGAEYSLDPARMALVLRRRRLDVLDSAERSPEESATMVVIVDFLHGEGKGGALEAAMDELGRIARLEKARCCCDGAGRQQQAGVVLCCAVLCCAVLWLVGCLHPDPVLSRGPANRSPFCLEGASVLLGRPRKALLPRRPARRGGGRAQQRPRRRHGES